MERHPKDYEAQVEKIALALNEPDVILAGNRPNTGVIMKKLDNNVELVLRLKTGDDPSEFENSVISFWTINDKKWNQYLRTKIVLYKRE